MKNASNWIAVVIVFILTLILVDYNMLQKNRIFAARNMKLLFINDSINSMNVYLTTELMTLRQQLQNSGTTPPLAKAGHR